MKLDRRQLRKIILFEANKLTLNEQTASIDAFKEQSGKTYDRIVQGYEASDTALGKLEAEGLDAALAELIASPEL